MVTLTILSHVFYSSVFTIYSFTIKMEVEIPRDGSCGHLHAKNISPYPTMQQILFPVGYQSSITLVSMIISLISCSSIGTRSPKWTMVAVSLISVENLKSLLLFEILKPSQWNYVRLGSTHPPNELLSVMVVTCIFILWLPDPHILPVSELSVVVFLCVIFFSE